MKKYIVAVVIVLILFAGFVFTKNNKGSLKNGEEIKIGSILILTGEGASWGESSKNGIDLAVEEINKDGGINGKKLTVVHEDNASEPKKAISAFNKLTDLDGVKFIIGPNWSNSGLPLVDLAKQKKVVMISPSLGVKDFNEANEYLFNTWPHDFILSRNLADYVYEKGFKNVALFGAQDVWVKDQTKNFKERFEELGGKVSFLYEPNTDQTDVRTEIAKLKNNKSIDAVVMTIDGYSLTDVVAKQLKDLSVKLPIFSITIDKKIIADCQNACEGMTFLTFLTPSKSFEEKYVRKYNREVEIGADSAYDAVMMLAKAMRYTKSEDPDIVSKFISSMTNYDGISGKLVSDGKRAFTKDYLIKIVKNGEPVTVSK